MFYGRRVSGQWWRAANAGRRVVVVTRLQEAVVAPVRESKAAHAGTAVDLLAALPAAHPLVLARAPLGRKDFKLLGRKPCGAWCGSGHASRRETRSHKTRRGATCEPALEAVV